MKKITFISVFTFFVFTINTFAQNTPPVAVPDTVTVMAENWIDIEVLLNDYDPDGDDIIIKHVHHAAHGERDYNDTLVQYRSDYYFGSDSMDYRIKDNGDPIAYSEYVNIHINVLDNPNLPEAHDDNVSTLSQLPISINVLLNDTDPNGDEIILLDIEDYPNNGDAYIDSDSIIVYVPDIYFIGTDSLTYTVIEKNTANEYFSNEATVYITVEENPNIPVAVDDEASTITFEPVNINVLLNDDDPNGDELMVFEANNSSNSMVEVISDSILLYASNFFIGTDTISYRVKEKNTVNNYVSEWANVLVEVAANPDIPIAIDDTSQAFTLDSIFVNVLLNDFDPQGEPIEIMDVQGSAFYETIEFTDSTILYYSSAPLAGIKTIKYRIRETDNPEIYSDWAILTLNIAQNPELPQVVNDYASTKGGIAVEINVLENDINPTTDILTIGSGDPFSSYSGVVDYISDSIVRYTPYYSHTGIDSICYRIGGQSPYYFGISLGYLIVDVLASNSYAVLDKNNINAGFNSFGYLFNNLDYLPEIGPDNWRPSFEVPAGSGKQCIFGASLWMGGLDVQDSLHFAGDRYKYNGSDFFFGPVSDNYNDEFDIKWIQLWKLNKTEIIYHKYHYGELGYEAPADILSWPGNGDTENGQAEQLAPYFDKNENGAYEPLLGDYPLIRGDQAVYFIYNDDRFNHTQTDGKKLGVEFHGMAYAFDEPADSVLWNTIFVHYDIYNRSDTAYTDTYIGNWTDFDIGYAMDDFVKSDVQHGTYIGYNGYPIDGAGEPVAYGENPPALGITTLGGPFMDSDESDNPAGGCDESINGLNFDNGLIDDERFGMTGFVYHNNSSNIQGDPQIAPEYYNYLRGFWKDNTRMQYGGNGHFISGALGPDCNFMFPGDSDPCNWGTNGILPNGGYNQNGLYWTEEEVGNNPDDRRGLGISGPFTFNPGDKQELDFAYTFARDYTGGDPVGLLLDMVEELKEKVVEDSLINLPTVLGRIEKPFKNPQIQIYPNPVKNNILHVDCKNILEDINYTLSDISGILVQKGSLSPSTVNSIEINNVSKGVYILQIQYDNKLIYSKFIKQ